MVAATPIALGVTFGLLAIIAVWARFWARRKKRMTWRLDDWMLVPSLILTLGNVVVMFIAATLGHMGELRPLDHRGFPPIDASFQTFYKCIYANKLLTTVAIALIRYAILLLYGRIFRGRAFTVSLWVLYFLNGAWGIAFTFMFIFSCRPISDGWKSPVGAKGRRCLPVSTNQASAVSSAIIDFLMLLIPWAPILRLQMNKKEKAAVLGIFGLGFIVLVTAIGKTVEFYAVGGKLAKSRQIQYIMAPTMYWSVPETCIAVIGACLPTLRPLFHGWSPESVIGSVRSALSLKSFTSNNGKPSNALTLQSHSESRSGDSFRGLRESQEHEIPPIPKSEAKAGGNRGNQIHVESQIVVQSSDAKGQRSGLSDDP